MSYCDFFRVFKGGNNNFGVVMYVILRIVEIEGVVYGGVVVCWKFDVFYV